MDLVLCSQYFQSAQWQHIDLLMAGAGSPKHTHRRRSTRRFGGNKSASDTERRLKAAARIRWPKHGRRNSTRFRSGACKQRPALLAARALHTPTDGPPRQAENEKGRERERGRKSESPTGCNGRVAHTQHVLRSNADRRSGRAAARRSSSRRQPTDTAHSFNRHSIDRKPSTRTLSGFGK